MFKKCLNLYIFSFFQNTYIELTLILIFNNFKIFSITLHCNRAIENHTVNRADEQVSCVCNHKILEFCGIAEICLLINKDKAMYITCCCDECFSMHPIIS